MTESRSDKEFSSSRRQFAKKAVFAMPILTMIGVLPAKAGISMGMHSEPLRKNFDNEAQMRVSDQAIRRR